VPASQLSSAPRHARAEPENQGEDTLTAIAFAGLIAGVRAAAM
jgi:hypothetical protein